MHFLNPKILTTLLPLSFTLTLSTARYTLTLPPTLVRGPIAADFITPSLDQSDLAAPKLSRANASTFDWWYFDAVDMENPNASVAITFSHAGPAGFPLLLPNNTGPGNGVGNGNGSETGHALFAHVWVSFHNGSAVKYGGVVESARVSGSGDSSMAIWRGGGGWMGSEEGYEVEIDVPGSNSGSVTPTPGEGVRVSGRVNMEKITAPHSRCSAPNAFNTSLDLTPEPMHGQTDGAGFGWVNILPDAIASVDIQVNGERLRFTGYGYHDKNWSTRPFTTSTKTFFRGHAHIGLYSLVWISYIPSSPSGGEGGEMQVVSAFLARDGETVSAGCADGSVTIRPVTEQTEGGLVDGFEVVMPGARVSVATDVVVEEGGGRHVRWSGRARGDVGGVVEEGVAVFERFEY